MNGCGDGWNGRKQRLGRRTRGWAWRSSIIFYQQSEMGMPRAEVLRRAMRGLSARCMYSRIAAHPVTSDGPADVNGPGGAAWVWLSLHHQPPAHPSRYLVALQRCSGAAVQRSGWCWCPWAAQPASSGSGSGPAPPWRTPVRSSRPRRQSKQHASKRCPFPPGASPVHHRPSWALLSAMADYHQYDGPPRPRPKRAFLSRPRALSVCLSTQQLT